MPVTCFIGCDPGPTCGLALAYWDEDKWVFPAAYQCDADSAPALLEWLVELNKYVPVQVQVEEFRAGTGPGARGRHATVTRTLVDLLTVVLESSSTAIYKVRPAASVKPWATDKRLAAAGLLDVCHGMPHAADAMRHLLFTACHDGGVPDPLSKAGYTLRAVPDPLLTKEET